MKKNNIVTYVLAVVAVVAVILAVVSNGKKADLQKQVDTLTANVATLTGDLDAAMKSAADAAAATETAVADAVAAAKAEADEALAAAKAATETAVADAVAAAKAENETAVADAVAAAKADAEKAVADAKAEADEAKAKAEKAEKDSNELREKLMSIVGETAEKAGEAVETATEAAETAAEAVTETVTEAAETVAEAVTETVTEAAETAAEAVEAVAKEAAPVMTHADYAAAELETEVTVETYVQAKQSWWDNKATVYTQAEDGAYFLYNMAMSEEEFNALVPGTKIRVKGYKAEWSGEVEIVEATYEIIEGEEAFIAEPADVTELLGKDELIDHQNELVAVKGVTVEAYDESGAAFAYKDPAGKTDDLYFKVSKDGQTYEFCVEFYLCGKDTDVYKAVEALNVGDVIDLEGFLYWYNGANLQATKLTK